MSDSPQDLVLKEKTSTKKHTNVTVSDCLAVLSHDAPGGQELYAPHDAKTQRESIKHSFWEVRKQNQEKDMFWPLEVHQRLLGFSVTPQLTSLPCCPG